MKKSLALSFLFVSIIVIITSCKKTMYNPVGNSDTNTTRKIQFVLYTDKDFSNEDDLVTFRLSIQKIPLEVLWDSVLAPMRLKDIPQLAQKLVIEKAVPGNDPSLLKVGFIYSIENTGNTSHMVYIEPGENFKVADFNFH